MPPPHLPYEMKTAIAKFLTRKQDLNALAQTSRDFYHAVNPVLYEKAVTTHRLSIFRWAAMNGQVSTIQMLLEHGGEVPRPGSYELPEFYDTDHVEYNPRLDELRYDYRWARTITYAAYNGHVGVVELYLDKRGASPNHRDRDGYTLLHHAVLNNHDSLVRMLVERGASINHCNGEDQTPLVVKAAELGNLAMVECLLSPTKKRYPRNYLKYICRAVRSAIFSKSAVVVEFPLSQGAPLDIPGKELSGDPFAAAFLSNNKRLLSLVLDHGAKVSDRQRLGVYRRAAEADYVDMLKLVVEKRPGWRCN
ncbi:ankyrin [Aspergillus sclerotioniger CBS 115572]|uniref:Ankyrin n=1 Tax=Aspergillus sclerotioniger CBS 115572 TaxID=1450535 RepID=A0A317WX65_9EURO|nr:ankyrin [Aspergillus sclerotioniger CBS 115572]PWY88830.1 ankyrin [Aspergillus sclerotioniger CBS 115572]